MFELYLSHTNKITQMALYSVKIKRIGLEIPNNIMTLNISTRFVRILDASAILSNAAILLLLVICLSLQL